jgi:DNA-binding phage protein
MITRILLLTLATSVAVIHAEEKPEGEKPKRERRSSDDQPGAASERVLTKEEAEKVKAALEATKDAPAVAQAREAVKKAMGEAKAAREAGKTREEIAPLMKAAMEAGKAAREAHVAAAVATDASLQALFDKMKAAREKSGEAPKGPRPERKKPQGEPKKEA